MTEESSMRQRLKDEVGLAINQAAIDRALYVSVQEIADLLGDNIKSAKALPGIITGLGIKGTYIRHNGERHTWLTEEQAKLVIREVLSHPVRTRLIGEDNDSPQV